MGCCTVPAFVNVAGAEEIILARNVDRLLVAQVQVEGLVVLTNDPAWA